ncbi:MAG: arginine--tRNA ligase [Elusimicrobia bacterium]|nr:arginine--tRNA ligase [Elusimicrobiota bacterium]MBI4218090.1 arginine--tRNA ligase [Elusimicrobiota bacterium]
MYSLREEVKIVIEDSIAQCFKTSVVGTSLVEPPPDIEADLSTNVAILLSKLDSVNQDVQQIANALANSIRHHPKAIIRKVEVTEKGFINFTLDEKCLASNVLKVATDGENFLKDPPNSKNKKILVEFVSANPTGPLHIGHGRGAALGDSLARIYKQCGYSVEKEYYVNDMGLQMEILARSVEARHKEMQGNPSPFPDDHYKGEYIREIAQKMQEQHRSDFQIYPKEYLLGLIREDLEKFGVSFDHWFKESALHQKGKVEETLKILESRNCLKLKDGALWFFGQGSEEDDKDEERVLRRSDGRYTYFASDIAYHRDKSERGYSHCIDIWGHDHHGYVGRVNSAMETLGLPSGFLSILLYQLVSLKRGGKRVAMSTRSGEFVTLREIMDEVGTDACRFFFAMRGPNSQLEFDVDLAKKQSNENPVYYVQYVHARISSIFREASERKIAVNFGTEPDWKELRLEPEERNLMVKLLLFPDILEFISRATTPSPHLIPTYLIDCATRFHRFYDKHRVLDAPEQARQFRFLLLKATQNVVHLGLSLLGVSAPEKM